ncbi:Crp/Fnr family transcriptional regulator [Olivibacter jilunii]|uniref:Crp/Fnr family transcriptional regulator n=1 Tax=Olivibacter jilunii TaxID=985016 RepID=UPI003F15809A
MQEKRKYIQVVMDRLASVMDIPDELHSRLLQTAKLVRQPKMSVIEFEGDDSDGYLWYLVQGVAVSIKYDHYTDQEQALLLWKKGDIIFQPESFFEIKELQESIHLWDDSVLLGISYSKLHHLLKDYPDFNSLLLRVYSLRLRRMAMHNIALRYPAVDRVAYLLRSYPGVHSKVKQELLAHYLHIDRRTFNTCLKELR